MSDDELLAFGDDPWVQALRAPARAHELADEDVAVKMFGQAAPARRRRRRAATRAGIGGAGLLLGLSLTGGVAAAYTTGLPAPVQDSVHAAIDPLPLLAPPTSARHRARDSAQREAAAPARPAARPTPAPPAQVAAPAPRAAAPAPTGPTATSPRPASPSPSAAAAPPRPALTVAVSRRLVPVHGRVVLSGRLTRADEGLPGRVVYAAALPVGESTWRRVASARTTSDGSVSLTVPPLTTNVRLRLVTTAGVTSRYVGVAVQPTLTTTAARTASGLVVTVTADGGLRGDVVRLLRRDGTSWTLVTSARLDSDSTARFTVPGPGAARVRYLVRLPATARHAAAFVDFYVPARRS